MPSLSHKYVKEITFGNSFLNGVKFFQFSPGKKNFFAKIETISRQNQSVTLVQNVF